MKVIRAHYAGACYGVKRALELAHSAANRYKEVYTLGPLIHNPKVVQKLSEEGVREVSSLDEVSFGTVIIRSHGVALETYDEAEHRGLPIVDATCPYVARAQRAAEELSEKGCHIIVVGEAGHPEVEGLCSYANKCSVSVDVVSKPEDLPQILANPLGVVVQTTQTHEALEAILQTLRNRGIKPEVRDTICSATRLRQESAAELAKIVDAVVVIGGKNSSNTTRLAEICKDICPKTFHVESAEELMQHWFLDCHTVGVSAGASTPEDHIASVEKRLISF